MGFWIFMLIMNMLIPVTMIGFGKIFLKKSPNEINGAYGYRTSMSRKNKDTWEFAHKYFGRLWYVGGWILLPLTVIAMLFVVGNDTDSVGTFGGIVCMIQMVFLLVPIIPTETALRKNFNIDGSRKKESKNEQEKN